MQIENLCINCMKEKSSPTEPCPSCGFNNWTYRPSDNHLPPFTILNGKFVLGKVIGEGGFGIVYLALDLTLNVVVAIKELFPAHLMSRNQTGYTQKLNVSYISGFDYVEEVKNKFVQEAQTLARLQRTNMTGLVNIRELFEENGTAYMVMEYLEGKSLKEYIGLHPRIEFDELIKMLKPIISVLKNIHDANIIHRDISPDNIMILNSGEVKLLDFGGIKDVKRSDVKSEVIQVKKGYTPLEQYQLDGKIGPWTDIYALCATIYRCITGQILPEPLEISKSGITAPSKLGVRISRKAEAALMKGLEVDYEKRQKNIQELYDAFYGEETKNEQEKKRLKWPIIVAVAGVLGVAGVFIGLQNKKQNLPDQNNTVVHSNSIKKTEETLDRETESEKDAGQILTNQEATAAVESTEEEPSEKMTEKQTEKAKQEVTEEITEEPTETVADILEGTYILQSNQKENLILGVEGGYSDDGTPLVVKEYTEQNCNKFYLVQRENGHYSLSASHTGMYLAEDKNGILHQYTSDSLGGEENRGQWELLYVGENTYVIQNIISQRCIELSEDSGEVGKEIRTAVYNPDSKAQQWRFIWTKKDKLEEGPKTKLEATTPIGTPMEVQEGTYMFQAQDDEKFLLGVKDGYADNGMMLERVYYEERNSNKFYLLKGETGYYALVSAHANKFLAIDESGAVCQYEGDTEEKYQWQLLFGGTKNTYIFQNTNGKCIGKRDESNEVAALDFDTNNRTLYWSFIWTEKDKSEAEPIYLEEPRYPEQAYRLENGCYSIASAQNETLLLSVTGGYWDNGTEIICQTDQNKNSQRFIVENLDEDNGYSILAGHSEKEIKSDENSDYVSQYEQSEPAANTTWEFVLDANLNPDCFYIRNRLGMCLTLESEVPEIGTRVILSPYDPNNKSQKWYVRKSELDPNEETQMLEEGDYVALEPGMYELASIVDGKTCWAMSQEQGSGGNIAIVWDRVGDDTQEFSFEKVAPYSDNPGLQKYRIRPANTQRVLKVNGNGMLEAAMWTGESSQLWQVVYGGYGTYLLRSDDGKFVACENSSLINGSGLCVKTYDEVDVNQLKWYMKVQLALK